MGKKRSEIDEARDRELEEIESLYSPEYLMDCADDEAREERLAELKRRIELGAYSIDADSIAEQMLGRTGLVDD
jgi:anti-sigma28 factor (negative regulator of flagellin synthesis)